jgi:CubicO group peptidase (beta-lactamase class C family)
VSATAIKTELQESVAAAVERAFERGESGLGVAVYHEGELVVDIAAGIADAKTGRRVDEETVFWMGSVTKAISAVGLHIQAERGLIDYREPVATYWPEFGQHGKDRCTVLDALSHRSGVPIFPLDATPERMNDWDWVCERIAGIHPLYEPGTRNAYHSYTFGWIIGEVVRRTDPKHRPFNVFLREELFEPLGIDELWLGIPPEVDPRVAAVTDIMNEATYVQKARFPYERVIALPPAVAASQRVFGRSDVRQAGQPAAGAIANARSVARLFAMLAGGGELDGVRLLSEDRVNLFYAPRPEGWDLVLGDHTRMSIAGFWITNPSEGVAAPLGDGIRTFGHMGAGGNAAWADLKHRLAVAILANRPDGRDTLEENPLIDIADTIRSGLSIS